MRKCAALFCAVDNSTDVFRLFQFPSNVSLHKEWLIRSGLSGDLRSECVGNDVLYLCEVHFGEDCWEDGHDQKALKEESLPTIFQHICPEYYFVVVYEKLRQFQVGVEAGLKGISAIAKLKSEGKSKNPEVQSELSKLCTLYVASSLQKLRITLKSNLITCIEQENVRLAEEVKGLQSLLKPFEEQEL